MANKAAVALFLIICISFSSYALAVCNLIAGENSFCLTDPCRINLTYLNESCTETGTGNDPIILTLPNSITISFILIAPTFTLPGLTINTNAKANSTVNFDFELSVLTISNDLVLTGATTLNTVMVSSVVVERDLRVAPEATINIAGNVTVFGTTYIQGTLHVDSYLDFGPNHSSERLAWFIAKNANRSVILDGGQSGTAVLSGNGAINGSVTAMGKVTINARNVFYINGNLTMSSSTTLQIDVVSATIYDWLFIEGTFNRNGILFLNGINSFLPSDNEQFVFALHSNSSGNFADNGNNFDTASQMNIIYDQFETGFFLGIPGSSSSVALPFALICLCILSLVF